MRAAVLLGLLIVAPTLQAPGGVLDCDPACNVRVSQRAGEANTPILAADPADARRLLAVAKDYGVPGARCASRPVWVSAHASDDGGRTWRSALLPGWPGDPALLPSALLAPYGCSREPAVAFGPDGRAVVAARGTRYEPTLAGNVVEGIWAARTQDLGATWELAHAQPGAPPFTHEEPALAVDPEDGAAFLGWTFTGLAAVASSSDGLVWGAPSLVPDVRAPVPLPVHGGYGVRPALGPEGARGPLYVVFLEAFSIWVARSDDGGLTWAEVAYVDNVDPVALDHLLPILPAITVVQAGPHAGRVVVAWADKRLGAPAIVARASDDGAATFGSLVRLTDAGAQGLQMRPGLAAGRDGRVHAAWYDERDAPGSGLVDVTYARSDDGGATWSPNLRVTTAAVNPEKSKDQDGVEGALGDATIAAAADGVAHVAWTDTRAGAAQVWGARILP